MDDELNEQQTSEETAAFSDFPAALAIDPADAVVGLKSGANTRFLFSAILAWLQQIFNSLFIPTSQKGANGGVATLNASGQVPGFQLDLSGKQDKITASGILKGNGSGGVTAAQAGTDYATPDMIPSVPDPSDATPQALGTAAAGSSGDYSRADHVHQKPSAADVGALPANGTAVNAKRLVADHTLLGAVGWYHFLDIAAPTNNSRAVTILISHGYASVVGVLRIYFNRTSGGTESAAVNWLATTIPKDYVRFELGGTKVSLYVYKSTSDLGGLLFTVLSAHNRIGTNLADSILEWDDTAVTEPTTATSATADSRLDALYDGNGDQIDTTYLKASGVLFFSTQAVSAGTAQQILSISDATITADYVLGRIEFTDPAYITAAGSWATAAGSFTLTGTCTAATTANVLLIRKGN